jgi:simple sugar transport system substrate-binding protein
VKWLWLLALVGTAAVLAACGSSTTTSSPSGGNATTGTATTQPKKDLKVAAFYVAKFAGDAYGQAFLQAYKQIEAKYGVNIKLVENVPYTAQMTATMKALMAQGYNVLLDEDSSQQLLFAACTQYPQAYCAEFLPTVTPVPNNVIGQNVDEFAPLYVQGVAAGLLTKSGTLGFVNNFKTPNGLSMLNSFALGCQSVKPDCKVRNIYTNSYFNPPAEIEATNTLINDGADVIAQFMDDQSVVTTASGRGVWAFSTYTPMPNPPAKYVTGFVWTGALTNGLDRIFNSIENGTFQQLKASGDQQGRGTVFGTPQPVDVTLAPWGKAVPADVQQKADAVLKKMNGGFSPFTGPIYDAKGKLRIKAGTTLPIRSTYLAYQWNWPVKGVIGG